MNGRILNEDAGLHAYLYTEQGGAVLDAVLDEAVRLYDLAGAARADKITEGVSGGPATVGVALEHLIATGTLRVISREDILPELRVFAVDPDPA